MTTKFYFKGEKGEFFSALTSLVKESPLSQNKWYLNLREKKYKYIGYINESEGEFYLEPAIKFTNSSIIRIKGIVVFKERHRGEIYVKFNVSPLIKVFNFIILPLGLTLIFLVFYLFDVILENNVSDFIRTVGISVGAILLYSIGISIWFLIEKIGFINTLEEKVHVHRLK